MARASDLKLGLRVSLSDLHQSGIASTCLLKEVTDICNLLWHFNLSVLQKLKRNIQEKMQKYESESGKR
jgi:hypothetical protein